MAKIMYMGNEVQVVGTGAGGGGSLENVLTGGMVSDLTNYQTAVFDRSIASDADAIVKLYDTVGGTDYVGYTLINIEDIVTNGHVDFTINLHTPITLRMTATTIETIYYGGAWQNIYCDIAVSATDIF